MYLRPVPSFRPLSCYGSSDTLVLCGEGWEYDAASGMSTQSTHLLGVAIESASSTPTSIGKVDGSILNSHSVDVVGNVLRIATTVRNPWLRFGPVAVDPVIDRPAEQPIVIDSVVEQKTLADSRSTMTEEGVVFGATNSGTTSASSDAGSGTIIIAPPLSVILPPSSEPIRSDIQSTTENYIITLNLAARDGVMKELGRLQLGKPDEVFTAVRFFDNVAYAVTFERRDPLYVLNLSDARNPRVMSELDMTGFSSYLHSMNDDNTLILAIGEEADDFGTVLGLQITVFDMTNLADPKVAQRHVIEKESNSYSSTESMWDFMATRYSDGQLIMPLNIYNWEQPSKNFNGFVVFEANADMIREEFRISHFASTMANGENMCFSCGSSLPRRAMIFDGKLMTTDNHFVRSTDMNTCTLNWQLDITSDENSTDCCGFYVNQREE